MNFEYLDQYDYGIEISINVLDTSTGLYTKIPINRRNVIKYEVAKDASEFNYNIHLLLIASASKQLFDFLKISSSTISILITENGKYISDKIFKIQDISILGQVEMEYNLNIILISELTHKLLNSYKYARLSLDANNLASISNKKAYELLLYITSNINSELLNNISTFFTDSGISNYVYPIIDLPSDINDLYIFDFMIENYPPYYTKPYIIFDDLLIDDNPNISDYNLLFLNINNISADYQSKNVKYIKRYKYQYNILSEKELFNFEDFHDHLNSKLVLKNTTTNRIFTIVPNKMYNKDQIKFIDTMVSPDIYKKQLSYQKNLMLYNSKISTYVFYKTNLNDFQFLNIYNLDEVGEYNHMPISIKYRFIQKDNSNNYDLNTFVKFIKIPPSLVKG